MTDLDVLAFVIWGGGLFNVGILSGVVRRPAQASAVGR